MMTQSVMTQAANLFGNAAGSVTTKGKQSGSGFDLMIKSSMKAVQNNTDNTDITTVKKTSLQPKDAKNTSDVTEHDAEQPTGTTAETTGKQTEVTASNDTTKATAAKATEQTVKQGENPTKTGQTTDSKDSELTDDEQVLAQITAMLQTIRETVMQTLNLSSEELDQLMTEQGMSGVDLLQSGNLQQLVLASNGETDILSLLTDEDMATSLQQLLQTVDELKQASNLPLSAQQMKTILEQVQKQSQVTSDVIEPSTQSIATDTEKLEDDTTEPEIANTISGAKKDNEQAVEGSSQNDNKVEVTKAANTQEANTDTQSGSRKEEKQELKAEDQFQTFIDNLVKTSQDTEVNFSGSLERVSELREIASQIVERIKVTVQSDQTSMELQLNPENLGKVNLSVQSKNGVMTAQFVVQNETTKEAIESQLHILRETLNQQGVKVEAIEVTVSTYAFEQNMNQNTDTQSQEQENNSGKKITLDEAFNMTELQAEEASAQDVAGIIGSQIDYTA